MDGMAELTGELTEIEGVEGAELSLGDDGVTGVRVRLEANADADGVGRAVQEVMTRHGVRARLGTASPPAPPGMAAPVVSLADRAPSEVETRIVPSAIAGAAIAGVSVAESTRGLEISVSTEDGRTVSKRSRAGDEAVAEAVTEAAAELFGDQAASLIGFERSHIGDVEVVTVVVEADGGVRRAGAAAIGAAFPFAVARAVWAALGA